MISRAAAILFGALFACVASAAGGPRESAADQIAALNLRYTQVEEQLSRSTVRTKTEEANGETITQRAWFNGVGDVLKIATERRGAAGRELTEVVPMGFEIWHDGLFMLTRKEAATVDGTRVDESRKYFGRETGRSGGFRTFNNGVLLRELRKSARFPAGAALDTSSTRNVTVPAAKLEQFADDEPGRRAQSKVFDEPEKLADELKKSGHVEADPFAGVVGDSERFRLIQASASPDGRFAIAIGFDQPVDWSEFADDYFKDEEVYTVEGGDSLEKLHNYVVELATRRIIGETGGSYFGTRRRYNHRESTVSWSPDSLTFVQLHEDKWFYESCRAGRIGDGPKLIATADVGAEAEKHAARFQKSRGREIRGSIALHVDDVKTDGTILLNLIDQGTSVPHKGEVFVELKQTLRLRETPKGMSLNLVNVRRVPNN